MQTATKTLQAFSVHAHAGAGAVDYGDLFLRLARLDPIERVRTVGGRMVAIPHMNLQGDVVNLWAYEGDIHTDPLFLNAQSMQEHPGKSQPGDVLVQKTHAMIGVNTRTAVIELNGRGAKAADIAELLQQVGRTELGDDAFTIDLNPRVCEDFIREIDRFQRVRMASLKLSRPNYNWTDHRDHLTDMADQSDARAIDVTVFAERKQSLEKDRGVIRFIKVLVRAPLSIFRGAAVTGVRAGEDAETTITLNRFIEHRKARVRRNAAGHVLDTDIEEEMLAFLESLTGNDH